MRASLIFLAAAVAVASAVGCSDTAGPAASNPLAGLVEVGNDSASGTPDTTTTTPGHFWGYVVGYDPAQQDTLTGSVRIANATVAAYRRTASGAAEPNAVATVTTNGEGRFTFPTLAGGDYAVTFTPPAASPYRAGWTVGIANAHSADHPWWIMLPRK